MLDEKKRKWEKVAWGGNRDEMLDLGRPLRSSLDPSRRKDKGGAV